MRKCCCYQCKERKIGCHQNCDRYKKFCEDNEKMKQIIRKENVLTGDVSGGWSYTTKRKKDN